MPPLTDEQLTELGDHLEGTCRSLQTVLGMIGLEPDDYDPNEVEDQLLNIGIESCGGCGWWFESALLTFDEEANAGLCDDCGDGAG